VWRYTSQAGGAAATAASARDGSIVFGAADRLVRRLSADRGEVQWDSLTVTFFSPVTAPAITSESVFVADVAAGLYRLDLSDGGRDWEHQLNDIVVRSAPVVSGTHVLIGLNDGRLVALEPAQGNLVWQSEASPGLIGAIALSEDRVVAVKGGTDAGLVAFEHDPDGELVSLPSPTVVDPGRLFGTYALALLIASVAIYVPFRFLRSRMGPAFGEEGEGDLDDRATEPDEDDPDEDGGDR
jgi:outer membrane protein assembly factor BamB